MSKLLGWEDELSDGNIVSIQMNLLNRCTSKCLSCRKYEWPDISLPIDDVINTLEVLKAKGLQTVIFSGGEPLLYKDIHTVIKFCELNDIKFSLITTLITKDMDLLLKIAKTAERIHVSVDSDNPLEYKRIRGVDALDIVKHNIQYVQILRKEYSLRPVRISATIGKSNHREVKDLYDTFCVDYDCDLNYYFLHTWDDMKLDGPSKEIVYNTLSYILSTPKGMKTNAVQLLSSRFAEKKVFNERCYLPLNNATIDANGDIYPCCRLLNDNGPYGEQTGYSYGNIIGKTKLKLNSEFLHRFSLRYPLDCNLCSECSQRYDGLLEELHMLHTGKNKKPIFF